MSEPLWEELDRLWRVYDNPETPEAVKAETWNLIADFTVENRAAIIAALVRAAQVAAINPRGRPR
jgi:hypothetical protein